MIASHPIGERRKSPRARHNIPVKICQDAGDIVTETQNISRCGVYCRVDQYIAPMTKLNIHLLLSLPRKRKVLTKKITCEGIVVRSEPLLEKKGCHIAVFFNDISQKDAQSITDYVNICQKVDAPM